MEWERVEKRRGEGGGGRGEINSERGEGVRGRGGE